MEVAPSFIILKQEKLKLCLEQLPLHEDPWQKIWNNTGAQIGIWLFTSYNIISFHYLLFHYK